MLGKNRVWTHAAKRGGVEDRKIVLCTVLAIRTRVIAIVSPAEFSRENQSTSSCRRAEEGARINQTQSVLGGYPDGAESVAGKEVMFDEPSHAYCKF